MICSAFAAGAFAQASGKFLHNERIGIELTSYGTAMSESFWARDGEKWRKVLGVPADESTSGNAQLGIQAGRRSLYAAPPVLPITEVDSTDRGSSVTLRGNLGDWEYSKRISLSGNIAHVDVQLSTTKSEPRIEYILGAHAFLPDGQKMSEAGEPDYVYAPALRKGSEQVIGEHFFRAPAVIAQRGTCFAALMPDLDVLREDHPAQTIIDLDADNGVLDAPILSYGYARHRLSGHITFSHRPGEAGKVPQHLHFAYDLLLLADAPEWNRVSTKATGLDLAQRHLWHRYGSGYLQTGLPQTVPFAEYAKVSYPAAFAEEERGKKLGWWQTEMNGTAVGGVYAGWGYQDGNTSWQAWFNNLRSAYGMRWWGKKLNNADWIQKSELMLNMALAAPRDHGAFPTSYNNLKKQWQGCLVSPNPESYYCSADMAWKCYWLLRWYSDFEQKPEILQQCRELGDFFIAQQEKSGAIASWFAKDLGKIPVLQESAQTALPTWFLAELSDVTSDTKYLDAARRAGEFLAKDVVPQCRYYDFETFFSCSPKECVDGGRNDEAMRDPHTLLLPQNGLSMQWSAEALKRLWELTGDDQFRYGALQALDTMIMLQNVWNIPYRTTANSYGGFGAQNSDGEYNDARQAQFACTLCDFGAALGRKDYFERGVAALRGSFTLINTPENIANGVYPEPNYPLGLQPENFGHSGLDLPAGRTGFDWGEGSALTSAAYILQRYGGAFVYSRQKSPSRFGEPTIGIDAVEGAALVSMLADDWAVGIDGVTAEQAGGSAIFRGALISRTNPGSKEATSGTKFTVMGSPYKAPYEVTIKALNQTLGTFTAITSFSGLMRSLTSAPTDVVRNPSWDFEDGRLDGWTVSGNFPDLPSHSSRTDFHKSGNWFLGTTEDGNGGWDDSCEGIILSPVFTTDKPKISLLVSGGDSKQCFIALLDANSNVPLRVAHGSKRERFEEVIWDVSQFKGRPLRIKVADNDAGPWAHINVDAIHCTE